MNEKITEHEAEIIEYAKLYSAKTSHIDEIIALCYGHFSHKYSHDDMKSIIKKIIDEKILVLGFSLTRDEVVNNSTRKDLLQFIGKNPGSYSRLIRNSLKIGSNEFYWHTNVLEKFGLIKSANYDDVVSYFLNRSFQDYEYLLFLITNPKIQAILKICSLNSETISSIMEKTEFHYVTVKKHIEKLESVDLLIKSSSENKNWYKTNQNVVSKMKKIINSAFFADFSE